MRQRHLHIGSTDRIIRSIACQQGRQVLAGRVAAVQQFSLHVFRNIKHGIPIRRQCEFLVLEQVPLTGQGRPERTERPVDVPQHVADVLEQVARVGIVSSQAVRRGEKRFVAVEQVEFKTGNQPGYRYRAETCGSIGHDRSGHRQAVPVHLGIGTEPPAEGRQVSLEQRQFRLLHRSHVDQGINRAGTASRKEQRQRLPRPEGAGDFEPAIPVGGQQDGREGRLRRRSQDAAGPGGPGLGRKGEPDFCQIRFIQGITATDQGQRQSEQHGCFPPEKMECLSHRYNHYRSG